MRITLTHNKPKEEVKRSIDSALADAMNNFQKTWTGLVMAFSLDASAGSLKKRITGTVEVTNTSVIIDADLGFLERLLPGA